MPPPVITSELANTHQPYALSKEDTMNRDQHTPQNQPLPKPLLSVREFHRHFDGSIGINQIRAAVSAGRIKSVPVGTRKRLIPASELKDWISRETR